MQAPGLQEPAKKALATLDREWDGLIAHRDYPMVSLDNNLAESDRSAGPVVTRKNAGGSRNGGHRPQRRRDLDRHRDRRMAGLNIITYLAAYLDECGRNGGKAPGRAGAGTVPALERQPRRPPHLGTAPARRIKPAASNTVTGAAD